MVPIRQSSVLIASLAVSLVGLASCGGDSFKVSEDRASDAGTDGGNQPKGGLVISPSSAEFSSDPSVGPVHTFTITNQSGHDSSEPLQFAIRGDGASAFTYDTDTEKPCTVPVPDGGSCSVEVSFHPVTGSLNTEFSATLVATGGENMTAEARLHGVAAPVSSCLTSVGPLPIIYHNMYPGLTRGEDITIQNRCDESVDQLQFNGVDAGKVRLEVEGKSCGASLGPQATCRVHVNAIVDADAPKGTYYPSGWVRGVLHGSEPDGLEIATVVEVTPGQISSNDPVVYPLASRIEMGAWPAGSQNVPPVVFRVVNPTDVPKTVSLALQGDTDRFHLLDQGEMNACQSGGTVSAQDFCESAIVYLPRNSLKATDDVAKLRITVGGKVLPEKEIVARTASKNRTMLLPSALTLYQDAADGDAEVNLTLTGANSVSGISATWIGPNGAFVIDANDCSTGLTSAGSYCQVVVQRDQALPGWQEGVLEISASDPPNGMAVPKVSIWIGGYAD